MRINDFDEEFNFKKKRSSNTLFIIKIVFIIFAIFAILSSVLFLSKMGSSDSYEIEENGERYGNSEFIKYQGKISVPVPSGGRYFLNGVDINSFRTLNSGDRDTRIIGLDKNHVYFGNIAIPDLDPNKLEVIGNGYYTDGINTYFCSDMSERNKNLSSPMEIFQTLIYAFSKTKKPQTYIYPYKKVETDKRLKAVDNLLFFATDGDNVYYKGEVLENADLNTLKPIDGQYTYFADKENVYYKSKLLPIKNNGNLKTVSLNPDDKFLYDEANGYVFIEDYSFDREKAPYKVVGNNGTTLYNLIFIAKDGIYYYCNIATPYILEENTVKFIDYDLDLRVYADGSFKVLDRGEYKYHQKLMNYPEKLDKILKDELTNLIELSKSKKDGFNDEEIKKQFAAYERLKKKN